MIGAKFKKRVSLFDHAPLGVVCHPKAKIWYSLCPKFVHSSFSRFTDMVGARQNLNGSRDLATPFSGMICHSWARTCYYQPAYQIWSLYLRPLRRYKKGFRMWCGKWGGLGRL